MKCLNCNNLLVKRDNESNYWFLRRRTCNKVCEYGWRNKEKIGFHKYKSFSSKFDPNNSMRVIDRPEYAVLKLQLKYG